MTELEAAEVVAIIAATWPRPDMSTATQRAYERHLRGLEHDQALQAIDLLAATQKFLPSIAEIREAAVTTKVGHVRTGMEAWGDVVEAIRTHGVYPSLMPGVKPWAFEDALVTECVRTMGWRELCLSENDAADRARFCALYDELAKRERVSELTGRQLPAKPGGLLRGSADHDGSALGMEAESRMQTMLRGVGHGGK